MEERLLKKLHEYIGNNNPELLITLEQEQKLTQFLESKLAGVHRLLRQLLEEDEPAYLIEQLCMEAMTRELQPSRFNYVLSILQEDYEAAYVRLVDSGLITYEIVNMLTGAEHIFKEQGFSETNEDDPGLRQAVSKSILEYLNRT